MTTVTPIRILCVDDHAFLIEGLRARLDVEPDMEFVGRLPSTEKLFEEIERSGANIILMDIDMPGPDPFDAIDQLRRRFPEVRAVLLSAHVRDQYLDSAYRAGAWGYLAKSDPPEEVIEGIRKVARGELAYSSSVRARFEARDAESSDRKGSGSRLNLLTDRELQVLRLIARGMSRKAIAEQLCRSPMTIDNHRKSIMRKLDLHDRAELVRYAIAEGLVEV